MNGEAPAAVENFFKWHGRPTSVSGIAPKKTSTTNEHELTQNFSLSASIGERAWGEVSN